MASLRAQEAEKTSLLLCRSLYKHCVREYTLKHGSRNPFMCKLQSWVFRRLGNYVNRAAPGCNEKTHQQGEEGNMPKYRKPTRGQEPKEALIVRLCKARAHQSVEVEKMEKKLKV